jgi:hypothetical protein
VEFHVKQPGNEEVENERDPLDQMRLQRAWGKRHRSPLDFLKARDGDHILVPFECDLCIFRKLRKHPPDVGSATDRLLMACIRRANLDSFWSRATDTVRGNRDKTKMGIDFSRSVGLEGPYLHEGSLPPHDHCGYEVAIQMLLNSRRPGRHSKIYCQFETIRKLRTCHSNQVRASPQSNRSSLALGDQKGRYQRFSSDPCSSFWFHRFADGCRIRMGQVWRPNKALSMELLHKLLEKIETRITESVSDQDLNRWIVLSTYVVVSYVVSLRGTEGLLLDLAGLHRHKGKGGDRYEVIALLGKIKGEHHDNAHLLPCVPITSSGVKVKESLRRLMAFKRQHGFVDGPAISDLQGRVLSTKGIDDSMLEVLEEIFETSRYMFPPDIENKEILRQKYQAFRTLRRTSDTRALEMKVSKNDIDIINRWQDIERAQGNRPSRPMRQHYAQLELLIAPFLRYTWAM